jgi:hypothetical protein
MLQRLREAYGHDFAKLSGTIEIDGTYNGIWNHVSVGHLRRYVSSSSRAAVTRGRKMTMLKRRTTRPVLVLALWLSGCGGDDGFSPTRPTPVVTHGANGTDPRPDGAVHRQGRGLPNCPKPSSGRSDRQLGRPGVAGSHRSLRRAAWRPQNLDDGAMNKLLVGAAAFGCRRDPSGAGADKTEIPVWRD